MLLLPRPATSAWGSSRAGFSGWPATGQRAGRRSASSRCSPSLLPDAGGHRLPPDATGHSGQRGRRPLLGPAQPPFLTAPRSIRPELAPRARRGGRQASLPSHSGNNDQRQKKPASTSRQRDLRHRTLHAPKVAERGQLRTASGDASTLVATLPAGCWRGRYSGVDDGSSGRGFLTGVASTPYPVTRRHKRWG